MRDIDRLWFTIWWDIRIWWGPSIGALWSTALKPTTTSKYQGSKGSACLGQKLPWKSKQWISQL